jgi:hypothetical protein
MRASEVSQGITPSPQRWRQTRVEGEEASDFFSQFEAQRQGALARRRSSQGARDALADSRGAACEFLE